MPDLSASSKTGLAVYSELKRRVRLALAQGEARAREAYEKEIVRSKWEAGKLIQEHILLNQDRAQYGEQVLKKLSRDLNISDRELRYMIEFSKAYEIWPSTANLSWGHYRELLAVNEADKRAEMAERSVRENWSQKELRRAIAALRIPVLKTSGKETPLNVKKGKLYTYKIVAAKRGPWKGQPVIDLGFSNYFRPDDPFKFKAGDFVESRKNSNAYMLALVSAEPEDLFTYEIYVDEITDGDTIWALVDLGFGFTTQQCLRFRGIDCPRSAAGKALPPKSSLKKYSKKPRAHSSPARSLTNTTAILPIFLFHPVIPAQAACLADRPGIHYRIPFTSTKNFWTKIWQSRYRNNTFPDLAVLAH